MKKAPRARQPRKKPPEPALPAAMPESPAAWDMPASCAGQAACPCGLAKPEGPCAVPAIGQAGVVEHLQDIVRQSVAEGNMQHALKAIELLGKHLGMFRERAADKDEQRAEIRIRLDLGGEAERGPADAPST